MIKDYRYIIGIDPGVNTGFVVWNKKDKIFRYFGTIPIHKAIIEMQYFRNEYYIHNYDSFVRVEDARKRKWFGNTGKERLKGAGSIERDCKIWEDFLIDLGVDFEMVHPKNNKTKWSAEAFEKVTKFNGRSSQHARDAAMLVYGL